MMRIPVESLPQPELRQFWAKLHVFLFAKGKIAVHIAVRQKMDVQGKVLRMHPSTGQQRAGTRTAGETGHRSGDFF